MRCHALVAWYFTFSAKATDTSRHDATPLRRDTSRSLLRELTPQGDATPLWRGTSRSLLRELTPQDTNATPLWRGTSRSLLRELTPQDTMPRPCGVVLHVLCYKSLT